ncbi:T9SS type A sorting domain-containing protein [bacterium]|nr:T9SS type A sorting domain-containing protein [bacterium]
MDGRKMFPIGLVELGTYAYPDDWNQRIVDSGANLVWDIEIAYADTTPGCDVVFDNARAGGYYLMIGSGDTWNWDDPATPQMEVDKRLYEFNETAALMSCVQSRPNRLIAFANRDEPVWQLGRGALGDVDAPHIHETYAQLKSVRSDVLVGMNFAPAHASLDLATWKNDIRSFTAATDIMMFAAYPYPAGPGTCQEVNVVGYPACTMDRLVIGADIFLNELNDPGQPLWTIIQAFKNIPLKEARWEAAASVVHGATGILWAGWTWEHWAGNGADNWPVVSQVMSEFSDLHDWLVSPVFDGVTSDHPDVEVRAFESRERVVVFAISRNGYTGPATISMPGARDRRVRVLNENRRIEPQNEAITDTFDGYEAHIYRYNLLRDGGTVIGGGVVDAPDELAIAPERFAMEAFPNPTAGRTTIRFTLPTPSAALFTVYDAAGRRVAVAGRGAYEAGEASIVWSGRDLDGEPVAPGVYFVRGATSDGNTATARVLVRH